MLARLLVAALLVFALAIYGEAGSLALPLIPRRVRLRVSDVAQYLVRPDGYIAYRNGGLELGGVDRYLRRWLPGLGAR